jgi:uncharacterized protein
MAAPIVFFDLAGPDAGALTAFYRDVFDWEAGPTGAVAVGTTQPLNGTFRQDPAEKMLYLGVPDVTAALEAVVAHGGKVHAPRFEVKGVVVLGLFFDPAGNRMGLVEVDADGKAIIP